MGSGIFISYRRSGGLDTARNLCERLSSLNYKVFFDLTSMREGKFNQQIYSEIEQADDFVLILSEGALDRCVEEPDWVRMEIQRALALHKNIIPIWKTSFKGFPQSLPPDIAEIKHYDCVKMSDEYYEAFFQKLLTRIKSKRSSSVEPPVIVVSGQDSRFFTLDEWLNKHFRFNALRFFRWTISILAASLGVTLLVIFFFEGAISQLIVGIAGLVLSSIMFYLARFMQRLRKRFSSTISEIERGGKMIKIARNAAGEIGLIRVGYSKIKIILPCKYLNINRMDRNNFILENINGKALYNRKRDTIIGPGPYDTIRKTKYKIECIGKDGVQLFSLDGYQRYD